MSDIHLPERRLWVIESSGGPRSGKGTITKYLGNAFPGAQTDETGADYRAVTLGLLNDGILDVEMPKEVIGAIVLGLSEEQLASYAAHRQELVSSLGESALYDLPVDNTVAKVSPHPNVRVAVKKGFELRVRKVVEHHPDTTLLVVDGRALKPTIDKIPQASFLLRMFIDCSVPVAVLREAARNKIEVEDPRNIDWLKSKWQAIVDRRKLDEERTEDPALKDDSSIDYWHNNLGLKETIERDLRSNPSLSYGQAMRRITSPRDNHTYLREGIGRRAYIEGRQVYIDTSDVDLEMMVRLAHKLVDEAFGAFADQN